MAINDFKAFATGDNANVLSQNEYENLEAITKGFRSGIARSEQLNKVWRQASTIAAVVAEFMADKSGDDVLDDGNQEKLRQTLVKALLNNSTSQLDGRYLKSASNLSDLANAATARGNLGLKGAAVQEVGTSSGTVAAGNDSRIVNAAQRGNNLSDLTDKAVARTNLGLGSAALVNAQTSKDDVTAGRAVLTGNAIALRTNRYNSNLAETDFNNAPQNSVTFVYSGAINGPGSTGSVLDFSGLNGGYNVQICGSYIDGGKDLKFRTRNGDKNIWGSWNSIYHTGNKPTAGDTGALPLSGGTLSGALTVNVDGEGVRLKTKTSGISSYIISRDSDNSELWYIGKESNNNDDAVFNNYKGGNSRIELKSDGRLNLVSGNAKPIGVNHEIQSTSANALRMIYGNYGAFWRQDGIRVSLLITNSGDQRGGWNDLRPFQVNLASGEVYIGTGLSVTGMVTPTNYSNFDTRYQAKNTASKATNGWFKDTSTGMIFQWGRLSNTSIGIFDVTFPVAFPSACVCVSNTVDRTGMTAGADNWSTVRSVTRTGFQGGVDRNGSYWMAIGF